MIHPLNRKLYIHIECIYPYSNISVFCNSTVQQQSLKSSTAVADGMIMAMPISYTTQLHVMSPRFCTVDLEQNLPAPIAPAARSNERPPNRMERSAKTRVCAERSVLLVFQIEAGISWSVPELLYLLVLKIFQKITNSRLI
jgi:hypothetical protein